MSKTLPRHTPPIKYAASAPVQVAAEEAVDEAEDDSKTGPLAKALKKVGWSSSAGGAHQRMQRARAELSFVVAIAVTEKLDRELDEFLSVIDEIRTGGVALEVDNSAWVSIEKIDAADNPARLAYLLNPTLENAKALLLTTRRLHIASLEAMRCLRTRHPELARC